MSKTLNNITANGDTLIATVGRPEHADTYRATVVVAGGNNFDSGTVKIQLSPDGGSTKIDVEDSAGVLSTTTDAAFDLALGWAGKNGEEIQLYANLSGSGGSSDINVYVFDNK